MTTAEKPVILVLGATGGIGQATVHKLMNQDVTIALSGKTADKLSQLAESSQLWSQQCDATNPEAVKELFSAVKEKFGKLDGVVYSVGSILLKPASLIKDEEWQETLDLNLTGAFYVLRQAVKAMTKTGGSIVFITTAAARLGLPNHEAIAAAKAGLIGMAQSAAATYANKNIRINCVAPGLVETPLSEKITNSEMARNASLAMHPLKKLGKPEQIASAITWLLSPEQSWVTGQVIGVDGGLATLKTN